MLNNIIPAIKKAGEVIEDAYKKAGTYRYKNGHDLVTDTDIAAEKIIIDSIIRHYPQHSIFSEEMGERLSNSDYLWIVDPLDGTTNFSYRIPHFCISVALTHKKEIVDAVVYDPLRQELFSAEKKKGAYLNNTKLNGSTCSDMSKAISYSCKGSGHAEKVRFIHLINALIKNVHSARAMGSTALGLCYAAAGRVDIYANNACNLYDWAAGALIARETGMLVSDFKGNPLEPRQSDILVANTTLHPQVAELINHI